MINFQFNHGSDRCCLYRFRLRWLLLQRAGQTHVIQQEWVRNFICFFFVESWMKWNRDNSVELQNEVFVQHIWIKCPLELNHSLMDFIKNFARSRTLNIVPSWWWWYQDGLVLNLTHSGLGWQLFMSCSLYSNISSIFDVSEATKVP